MFSLRLASFLLLFSDDIFADIITLSSFHMILFSFTLRLLSMLSFRRFAEMLLSPPSSFLSSFFYHLYFIFTCH